MARQNHTSINIDSATTAALDARRRDGETRSSRLAADIAAYHSLLDAGLRHARRTLSPAEASAILDVFNGTPPGQVWNAERMALRLSDALCLDGLTEKWGVDIALVGTIKWLGDFSAAALADWAEGVWGKRDFDVAEEVEIFKGNSVSS